ncbi:MAG: N-6 DNA methylase, partial [Clostridiales bacterium]|nr:N-6 DNA methylase [Clostridiales bacterium]
MGIGNFFGLLPENMKDSELYGVELDSITGRIAKQLYPNADIQVKGFEKTDFDSGFFDAAVGNVPFGNYRLYDEEFHDGELIHDFFFKKSLDKVRPGGLVAFVTSKGTLDKADTKVREYLAQSADLLGAIRLPNTAFKKKANTEVTADILFLKKRENLRDFEKEGKPEWTDTTTTLDGLPINSYFVSHPQMVLGEMKEVTRRYGKETACLPFENKSLDKLLEEAVSELGKDIAALDN